MQIVLLIAVILGGFILLKPGTALGFVKGAPVDLEVTDIGDYGCVLRSDAASAWISMKQAAFIDGVTLRPEGPRSAFRTAEQQAAMLLERPDFAAAQNHSPHQAGIAVDVFGIPHDATPDTSDVLSWLQANAPDYGFYPLPGAGAQKEPWHWEFRGTTQVNTYA